ncbi:hypothetical protein [Nocardia seriolae]|nr:hypothetical protein [Nocardia seriolae]WNJ57355.1 hypothetical protein RMO66_28585 [Nocardia seriolae]
MREIGPDGPVIGTAGLRRLDGGPELAVVYSLDPGHHAIVWH